MNRDTQIPEVPAGETPSAALSGAGVVRGRPPGDFVYDNGQILLELLRGRAAEEQRRRFVAGLRRSTAHSSRRTICDATRPVLVLSPAALVY